MLWSNPVLNARPWEKVAPAWKRGIIHADTHSFQREQRAEILDPSSETHMNPSISISLSLSTGVVQLDAAQWVRREIAPSARPQRSFRSGLAVRTFRID